MCLEVSILTIHLNESHQFKLEWAKFQDAVTAVCGYHLLNNWASITKSITEDAKSDEGGLKDKDL